MFSGIELITSNLAMNFENIILFITIAGGIIIYAKSFNLGLVFQIVTSALLFIWFYEAGYNYVPSLSVLLISIVILALSLYTQSKIANRGDYV